MNNHQREEAATKVLEEIHASGRQWAYAEVIGEEVIAQDEWFLRRYRLASGALNFLFGVRRPEVPEGVRYVPKLRAPLRHLEQQAIIETKLEEIPDVPGVEPRQMFRLVQ